MTIKDCIDIVDNIKPNQYTIKDKVMWLSFLEEIIINEVLKTHEGYDGRYDNFEGYSEDRLTIPLIVPSPYDRLYTEYLKMMIDKENGEIARYNNSMVSYNTYMMEYRKYYNKTHMPLDITAKRRDVQPHMKPSVGLSEAEYENLKREMTYILTEYFSKEVSPDKLQDIVRNFILTNIDVFKGKDGRDGVDGKDGYTPQKNIDYFDGKQGRAFTYADFTSEQLETLKGPKGDKGDKGDQGVRGLQGLPGYTPLRGTDYWTSEDEAEMKNSIGRATAEATSSAERSAVSAEESKKIASQALADLLAMINSGDIVLATGGKLPLSAIPATATQEIYVVGSEDELTSLVAQRGDLAELVEDIDGERTITKTWQCLGDASVRENWVVWGTSYAVQSGNATTADNAVNANMINNHRLVEMTEEDFASAVKDENTYYLVY